MADEAHARIYRKVEDRLELIEEACTGDHGHKPNKEDAAGKAFTSSRSSVRHAFEPHTAATHHEAVVFAKQLADWLDKALRAKDFDRLIMIADPKSLGNLRHALSKQVASCVTHELNKDLTGHNTNDLQQAIEKIL